MKKRSEIVVQPINDTIDELKSSFESSHGLNPYDEGSLKTIFGSRDMREDYLSAVTSHISEESDREIVLNQIDRSMQVYDNSLANALMNRGEEGFTHEVAPGSNQGAMDALTPFTIVGYNAKSIMNNVFTSVTHKTRHFPIELEVAYVIDSNSTDIADRKTLPAAIRDGSISDMLDADKVTLTPDGIAAGAAHVTVNGGIGYAAPGNIGNAIEESGKDIRDWALSQSIAIDKVLIDTSAAEDGSEVVTQVVAARSEIKGFGGDSVSKVDIQVKGTINITGGGTEDFFFVVILDRDTGIYHATACNSSRVLGFSFDVPFLNPVNLSSVVKSGRTVKTAKVTAKPRKSMGVGLSYDLVMNEFKEVEGSGADVVKFATNVFSKTLAGVNDTQMEKYLIAEIDASIVSVGHLNTYIGTEKLGGYAANVAVDLAARPTGGGDPFSWINKGIKDAVNSALIDAESDTEYDEVDKVWSFFGYSNYVRRFVDTTYFNTDESDSRYGFKKSGVYAYSDQFNNKVTLYGSSDKRHKTGGRAGKVYGFMKSNQPKRQPSGIYYGYDFRIVKTRGPRQGNIDNIQFWVQDVWEILGMCGVRVTLSNYDDTYAATVTSAKA